MIIVSELLLSKIKNKSATIGVVGLGYVGLPLAMEFNRSGYRVTGIDIDKTRVATLNLGENYIQDVDDEFFKQQVADKRFSATTDFAVIQNLDVVTICVPTPLNKLKDPDVSYIVAVLDELVKYLHKDIFIILESTTYPGTTRDLILSRLEEETGLQVGQDFFLCFSPERVDPGNPNYQIKNTPKVIGGITATCTGFGTELYSRVIDKVVPVSSPESAELVKLLENTFRSINIGLVNEMAIICEKLGVDVWEVIEAANTKPFGYMKFVPGPGLGGHCIPIDPHYLAWKLKSLDYKARFIELAGEINTNMPYHVVDLVSTGLNQFKKAINGSKLLLIGIAYKKDIDDVRESPALDVLRLLENQGAEVDYYDPFVPMIKWNGDSKTSLSNISPDSIQGFDAVVILTAHSNIDYRLIREQAQLIIDTRNTIDNKNKAKHIIKLGVGFPGE
ncbi:MAG: nucleotide sugar dehydrogenase [Candidatus Marinimicrobia bacterium]|nr:nucleotide sugar dehydrogenase [Candidatus Neomarinimicrobiota bacterium]